MDCKTQNSNDKIQLEGLDRQLKEQFIHGINDNDVLTEIIHELTTTQIQVQ